MSRYLVKRMWGEASDADMADNARRALAVTNHGFEDIHWEHSHVVVGDDGSCVSYCVYQAPDVHRLLAHAEATGGHVVDAIFQIGGDVRPEDFG